MPDAHQTNRLRHSTNQADPPLVRWLLIIAALAIVGLLIVVPVASVFAQAFADGVKAYWTTWRMTATRGTRSGSRSWWRRSLWRQMWCSAWPLPGPSRGFAFRAARC